MNEAFPGCVNTNLCSGYLFLFPHHDAQDKGGPRASEDQFKGSSR